MLEDSIRRQLDINYCYNKIAQQSRRYGKMPKISTLVAKTITSKAPSYYITFDHARRLLSQYRRDKLPRNFRKLRRDMIKEIASKVDRLLQSQHTLTESDALAIVLARSKASRFFISPASARRLINSKQ